MSKQADETIRYCNAYVYDKASEEDRKCRRKCLPDIDYCWQHTLRPATVPKRYLKFHGILSR